MSEDRPEAPAPAGVTPELIMQLGTSFMATRHLIAASDIGVFEALGDDALDLDALAARIAVPRRTARICADAMVALGLLERDGDLYRNSPVAGAFLSGRDDGDLRPFLRYLDVSYRAWTEFTGAIRAGEGSGFITWLDSETSMSSPPGSNLPPPGLPSRWPRATNLASIVGCLTWVGEPARSWCASSTVTPLSSADCSSSRTWSSWEGKT
jgi:hypothetical protein